jgi:flavorubredoxin
MRQMMLILAATAAVLLFGSPTMQANAQMSRALAALKPAAQNYTPIEKAACFGWGRCPPGRHQICGPRRCWCAPC